jgi:hypothetical protein
MNKLAQETVQLHLALVGYDRQVLLRHEVDVGPFELSKRAEKLADVVDLPTKDNLAAQLNDLRQSGHIVDLYVFSHGSTGSFIGSKGTYGENTTITDNWLRRNVPEPLKLRAVWQCNCYGASMAPCWHDLGAKVVAGTRDVNFYPIRFKGFAKLWGDGERFSTAVSRSDTKAAHTPSQAYILTDALGRLDEWDGNVLQATRVLGNNKHARRYFEKCWFGARFEVVGRDGTAPA